MERIIAEWDLGGGTCGAGSLPGVSPVVGGAFPLQHVALTRLVRSARRVPPLGSALLLEKFALNVRPEFFNLEAQRISP